MAVDCACCKTTMSRAQMTVLAVVVGIAIFLGVAVTLALLVFSVMSTRDIVRLDSQVRELTSVVSALSHSLQEASSSSELRLEILNQTLDEKTSSTEMRLETINGSCTLSLLQLEDKVSSNKDMLLQSNYPESCQDYKKQGFQKSGVYTLNLGDVGGPFQVYCDMESDSYGWVVFQRRVDGSEDFYRTWADYKAGFGRLESEFWLGNDKLHRLTSAGLTRLRVDLEDWQNSTAYALYSSFSVAGEGQSYRLNVSGYNGTAGDSFSQNNGRHFSTKDRDNDPYSGSCASSLHSGAWWYSYYSLVSPYWSNTGYVCTSANLNGAYNTTTTSGSSFGVFWFDWKKYHYPLKSVVMNIR